MSESSPSVSEEESLEQKQPEYRYVLWIRHCRACHNDKSSFGEQPLCNENGINQAYEFGKQLIFKECDKIWYREVEGIKK